MDSELTKGIWRSGQWRWTAFWLFLFCTSVYTLTAPGRLDIIDGAIRFAVTDSLLYTGSLLVSPPDLLAMRGPEGQRYAPYPVGASLLGAPFVAIARSFDSSLESRQFAFSLSTVPFAAGAVTLSFFVLGRLGCGVRQALWGALVIAFATPLWPYAGSSFDAATQAFFLTLAVWGSIEAFHSNSPAWGLVAGLSFGCLLNLQEAFGLLLPQLFLKFPLSLRRIRERVLSRAGLALVSGAALGVAGLLVHNYVRFGNLLATGRVTNPGVAIGSLPVGFFGLLLSPAKSLFLFSPTFVAALSGLKRLIAMRPRIGETIAICVIVHLIVISSLVSWAGEWAWGPRYLVPFMPLLGATVPFALGRIRGLLTPLIVAGIVVQVMAISVDHQRFYFERGYPPLFWADQSQMYRASALLARPFEIYDVITSNGVREATKLAPTPDGIITDAFRGPAAEVLPHGKEWVRNYVAMMTWRPWPSWVRFVPQEHQPSFWRPLLIVALISLVCATAMLIRMSATVDRDEA